MNYDLDALSREELLKLRTDVEKALATLAERERQAALDAAEEAARAHGFSLKDLTGVSSAKAKTKAKNPPKYRHPDNPEVTWTGRGRKPQWIKEAEEAGQDISDFAV